MLDIPVLMGTNAPWEHQRVIRKLISGLGVLYDTGVIKLEPLPEAMVNESETSPTPDVILVDNVLEKISVIIEVTSSSGFKKDFQKIIEITSDYEVGESFVYNYRKNLWRKYQLGVGEITDKPSFCEAIGYDLNDFLQ
jgi:Uma2 family endonuclease